jgi:hypothetical protein
MLYLSHKQANNSRMPHFLELESRDFQRNFSIAADYTGDTCSHLNFSIDRFSILDEIAGLRSPSGAEMTSALNKYDGFDIGVSISGIPSSEKNKIAHFEGS